MGNADSRTLKIHYETAKKTGALDISNRGLSTIPSKLTAIDSLRQLDMSRNKLQKICVVKKFGNLKSLKVDRNKLSELPEFSDLRKLELLSACYNKLQRVPESIGLLDNLKEIRLSNNQLDAFPVQLCLLKHLTIVDLSHNKISVLPVAIGSIQAAEMNFDDNLISIIAEEIANASKLKILRLERNQLKLSAIPKKLLTDSPVHSLFVDGNLFDRKAFEQVDGYDDYMNRYTETKKKLF